MRGVSRAIPEDRFHELIEAATGVFLEEGYRRAQMAVVAARMGVAKGTLYLYVESKEALFHEVLRHADRSEPLALPRALPIPTPAAGATLEEVRKRIALNAFPRLVEALSRERVVEFRAELEGILHELYRLLARNRVGIKLLDRCAPDYPELAALWFGAGREGVLGLLRRYLEDRARRRRLAPIEDPAITARIVLESVVFWAVHRPWDPVPQRVDDEVAERCVVEFVLRALLYPG